MVVEKIKRIYLPCDFQSSVSVHNNKFISQIKSKNNCPIFIVKNEDGIFFEGGTATNVWKKVWLHFDFPRIDVPGASLFGFKNLPSDFRYEPEIIQNPKRLKIELIDTQIVDSFLLELSLKSKLERKNILKNLLTELFNSQEKEVVIEEFSCLFLKEIKNLIPELKKSYEEKKSNESELDLDHFFNFLKIQSPLILNFFEKLHMSKTFSEENWKIRNRYAYSEEEKQEAEKKKRAKEQAVRINIEWIVQQQTPRNNNYS